MLWKPRVPEVNNVNTNLTFCIYLVPAFTYLVGPRPIALLLLWWNLKLWYWSRFVILCMWLFTSYSTLIWISALWNTPIRSNPFSWKKMKWEWEATLAGDESWGCVLCVCLFSFSSRGDFGVGVCVDVKGLPFIAIGLLSYIIILLDYKQRVRCIPPLPTLPIPSTTINHRPSTLMVTEHCQTPTTILAKRTIFVTPSTIPELCFFWFHIQH